MSDTQNSSTSTADNKSSVLGPGDQLQAARIAIGMTLEEVAVKMHLSTAILKSLEDNRFDEITAPIFVKGYLRSYARIVNVDEEEIIQQYSSFDTDGDPPISSTSNTVPEINAEDARVKGATWLIIIVLIGLLSAWWWNRYNQPAQPVSLDSGDQSEVLATTEDSSEPVIAETTEVEVSQPEIAETEVIELVSEPDNVELNPIVNEDSSTGSIQQIAREELNQINNPEPEAVNEPEPVIDNAAEPEPELEPVPEAAPVVVTTDNESDLVIIVNADTWADIKDADGNSLVYDLLKNGERLTLSGKAPFRAFLGNGYGVSITYQGEDIDLSNVIRADNTARISIGQ